jgi:hypothetical protein
MEKTAYSSMTSKNDLDFTAPIKILIRNKTMQENKLKGIDEKSEFFLKSCLKMKEMPDPDSQSNNKKDKKVVSFRNNINNKKPIEEVVRVISYKNDNLKNTFIGLRNKNDYNSTNDEVSCKCLIF